MATRNFCIPSIIGRWTLGVVLVASAGAGPILAAEPLGRAHAHNDYWHDRPLSDALDQGFCSVEADVFLVDGDFLVGHDRGELRPGRTLRRLYLDPLKQRVLENSGRVFPNGPLFMLLVDIKADGERAFAALEPVLHDYREMLCRFEDGQYHAGAVQVVLSGDRPLEAMKRAERRYSFYDGRLSDLESDLPATLMPLISDRWPSHFRWRGDGPISPAEAERLKGIVRRAHRDGRRVRFWATPEKPTVWRQLLEAGVDHINTDRLRKLADFLKNEFPSE
jgi:glycerophosphoryl diester phosphodiesterase